MPQLDTTSFLTITLMITAVFFICKITFSLFYIEVAKNNVYLLKKLNTLNFLINFKK